MAKVIDHSSTIAHTEAPGGTEHEAAVLGFMTPAFFVALAMLLVFALLIWKKVPAAIGRALDAKIAIIRDQLAEAEALRAEAEALKAEYADKASAADADAAAIVERAHHEADAIIAKASSDTQALIRRRQAMAEAKIGAEERAAVSALRAAAAKAATEAATALIAQKHDAKGDKALVDQAIAGL